MGKTRHQLAIVVTALSLILAASAGFTAWRLARTWLYPPAHSSVTATPQEPVTAQQPIPQHVITRDDFVGTWTGYWDGIYPTKLEIRPANGNSLMVMYDIQETVGGPVTRKQLHPTPISNELHMPRAKLTLTLSDAEPDTAAAVVLDDVNGIEYRRTATLVRGREAPKTTWLGNNLPQDQAPAAATTRPITLVIKATVDGSDVLRLSATDAEWEHKTFQPASDVSINGVGWDVQAMPNLHDTGLVNADFTSARVISRTGRDLVAMESSAGGLAVYFDDTPDGADQYEIKIAMLPKSAGPAPAPVPPTTTNPLFLDVSANVDDSDVMIVSAGGAKWAHRDGDWPTNVTVNGKAWDVQNSPTLADVGLAGADLSSASVTDRSGRDTVMMEKTADGIAIYFADSPGGSDLYHIRIRFERR